MFFTNLNEIIRNQPSIEYWSKLLSHIGKIHADNEPVSFKTILTSNGLSDAIWTLRCIDVPEVRIFSVRCLRQIQHLIKDDRSLKAIDIAELYSIGEAGAVDLQEAHVQAWNAVTDLVEKSKGRKNIPEMKKLAYEAASWVTIKKSWYGTLLAASIKGPKKLLAAQQADFINIFCRED